LPRNRFAHFAIAFAIILAGCTHQKSSAPERLAVVPFENLSTNTEFDWLGKALSAAVAEDLTGLPTIYTQGVDSFDGAYAMHASRAVEGYFVQSNGRLEVHATVRDLASRKTIATFDLNQPMTQGTIALANGLAKKLRADARAFPTTNEGAYRAYGEALEGGDRAAVSRALETASQDDPRFSLVYLERAQVLAGAGDRAGALQVIETAKRGPSDPITGAKMGLFEASLEGNRAAQQRDLEALVGLTPADSKVFEELGQVQSADRKFADAARSYASASSLNPEDAQLWNELGYARSYGGDLNGARSALEEYQRRVPTENVNPVDSLGEVSFYSGDFAAAEKYFLEADKRNAAEFNGADMLKAAQARLMTGDLAGADALFDRYAKRRSRMPFESAQWRFVTGRRAAAMEAVETMLPSLAGDARSLASNQLAIWKFLTGDKKTAEQLASQAAESALGPAARNLSGSIQAILDPSARPAGSRLEDAYEQLFSGKFAEATPLLETLYRQSDPHNDGEIRTLLAWTYVQTGRADAARSLIDTYPIPLSSSDLMFVSLIFPRFLFVRGAVLQQEGKRAEAKAAYTLFLKYSGDLPDVFGDEAVARKNLSAL